MRRLSRIIQRNPRGSGGEIFPEEIFLDSSNLPEFNQGMLEGRIERPIEKATIIVAGLIFLLLGVVYVGRVSFLTAVEGATYAELAESNHLKNTLIFAERGLIEDRRGERLAWNEPGIPGEFPKRVYAPGSSLLVGYAKAPAKDSSGNYYEEHSVGRAGIEAVFDAELSGVNGTILSETDVSGSIVAEHVLEPPRNGDTVTLSIDAGVNQALVGFIGELTERVGFSGGAGLLMDVQTGELLAAASYPEYSQELFADGKDVRAINETLADPRNPFLVRFSAGLYAPGSIVKPFVSIGALEEEVIAPEKQIESTGKLVVPNPYDPSNPSVFADWKAHGFVDMRHAIAVSSDVYFYVVGGGFGSQGGLGIERLERYFRLFGFGEETGTFGVAEASGTIPNPSWKEETFDDVWRLGDTYLTSIGQYGMQVTPLQTVRAIAAVANNGWLVTPTIEASNHAKGATQLSFELDHIRIAQEGMRLSVKEGTAKGLDVPWLTVAAKTGTAEIGARKQYVNSWVVGFFPYEHPRYAFTILMERGPHDNTVGGVYVMRQLLEWMREARPEYLTEVD